MGFLCEHRFSLTLDTYPPVGLLAHAESTSDVTGSSRARWSRGARWVLTVSRTFWSMTPYCHMAFFQMGRWRPRRSNDHCRVLEPIASGARPDPGCPPPGSPFCSYTPPSSASAATSFSWEALWGHTCQPPWSFNIH